MGGTEEREKAGGGRGREREREMVMAVVMWEGLGISSRGRETGECIRGSLPWRNGLN